MIYRVICQGSDANAFFLDVWNKADEPPVPQDRLMGAFAAGLPYDWADLRRPSIYNPRARFYFTEKGWERVGRFVAAAARTDGRAVRVLKRKNPARSEIVYEDELQCAILPPKRR